ncbi:MAG: hypothetical protein ACTSX6_12640 [Candidatus Heimdallarchaeaceae archaeon]
MIKRSLHLFRKLASDDVLMNPSDLWSKEMRFIEENSNSEWFGDYLINEGFTRYLVLVPNAKLLDKRKRNFCFEYTDVNQLKANNAEVLIFSKNMLIKLWDFSFYSHAKFIAWPVGISMIHFIGFIGWFKNILRGNIELEAIFKVPLSHNRFSFLLVSRIARKTVNTRRYLSPMIGIEGFLKQLTSEGVRYVLLRWFEKIPKIDPGEDLDILVHDNDIGRIDTILSKYPGVIPCDIYSASGLPRSQYQDMAYYPPPLALEILRHRILHNKICMVPSARFYFLSLAYHVLYHKGEKAGYPSSTQGVKVSSSPEHDYYYTLKKLAQEIGIMLPKTMEELDEYLNSQGWRPPRDTLAKLAVRNIWIRNRFFRKTLHSIHEHHKGLVVFIVRERVLELDLSETIYSLLKRNGFEVLFWKLLNSIEVERASKNIRGGNWGKGPFPQSGGRPAIFIVARDPFPLMPGTEILGRHPGLTNKRILKVKEQIREAVNRKLREDEKCNVIHSCDNEDGAIEYIKTVFGKEAIHIMADIRSKSNIGRGK